VDYPPFSEFVTFIQELSLERNDPNLIIEIPEKKNIGMRNPSWRQEISVKKTEIEAKIAESDTIPHLVTLRTGALSTTKGTH
jgi:hypothetical protein